MSSPDTEPNQSSEVEREKVAIAADFIGVNQQEGQAWSAKQILGEKYARIKHHADFLRAFTDENRLDIIVFLMHPCTPSGELCSYSVSEIAARFNISLSTVSHHLQELKRVGVVKVERRGKERYYQIDLDYIIERVGDWYTRLLARRDRANGQRDICPLD